MPGHSTVLERGSEAGVHAPARRDMAQMNIRIERALKETGDDGLMEAGYTPSQAVRQLWLFASEHRGDPGAIRGLLSPRGNASQAMEARDAAAKRGYAIVDEARARAGIAPASEDWQDALADSDLYAEALLERYEGRGLL